MGKVQSALRQAGASVGNWHDEPWREKDARAVAVAAAAGVVGVASIAVLYRTLAVRDRLHDARVLAEFAGGLGFLWLRTDARMDARAPQLLRRVTRAEHAAAVQAYAGRVRTEAAAAAAAAAAGVAVGAGHDNSNSFGRPVVHSLPRFPGSALVALHAGVDGGGGGAGGGGGDGAAPSSAAEPTVAVEPGMSMDQLFAATVASGLVAPVITEFPGITVGGAVMGGALESSSIRNGHFADALVALEVVLADGTVVECSASQRADLFYGIRGSYGTVGRVTLCTLRLERLVELAAAAAVPSDVALEVAAARGAVAGDSSGNCSTDGGGGGGSGGAGVAGAPGALLDGEAAVQRARGKLALALAGQAVEFRVQLSYILCPTVSAALGLLEALTKQRGRPGAVPEAERVHFVDAMLFQRNRMTCGFLARLSGNIVMVATVVANTVADARFNSPGATPAPQQAPPQRQQQPQQQRSVGGPDEAEDELPFGGDWFVCHVARILDRFSHSGGHGGGGGGRFTGAGTAAWSPSFHNWLLARHGSVVISTDRPVALRDYLFRWDRGAFWMGFVALPCTCGLHSLGLPCIDGLRDRDTRLRRWIGSRASTRNLYRCLHAVPKERQRRDLLIHDFQLPFSGALEFLQGRTRQGGVMAMLAVSPVWLCPIRATPEPADLLSCHAAHHFPPNAMAVKLAAEAAEAGFAVQMVGGDDDGEAADTEPPAYLNIGVYGSLRKVPRDVLENLPLVRRHLPLASWDPASHTREVPGNRADPRLINWVLEAECTRLGGRKLLYSQLYSGEHTFWRGYDRQKYEELRRAYGAEGRLPDIHAKIHI